MWQWISKRCLATVSKRRVGNTKWTIATQRKFFDELGLRLGIANPEDWYRVTSTAVLGRNGWGVLGNIYGKSLYTALSTVYKEHQWVPWRFRKLPGKLLEDVERRRECLRWIGEQLGVSQPSDWYKVTYRQLCNANGRKLLSRYYGDSIFKALRELQPEHKWEPWKFRQVPKSWWDSMDNQREYFASLATELRVTSLDDWYRVSMADLAALGEAGFVRRHYGSSLQAALLAIYPSHPWETWKFDVHRLKASSSSGA